MKKYYFISGLPRSGSTLLSAILKQNPNFHTDISSPIESITEASIDIISNCESNLLISENQRKKLMYSIFDGYYNHIKTPIIFDTSRFWTKRTNFLKNLFPYTKILCPVRDITSILNSFEFLFSKNCFHTKQINEKIFSHNIFIRTQEIFEREIINFYAFLHEAYSINPEMIYFIEYDNLCQYPEKTMKKIYDFLEIKYYHHDFNNIQYSNEYFDNACKVKDLHTLKKIVEYNPPKNILPSEIYEKYKKNNMEFWKKIY